MLRNLLGIVIMVALNGLSGQAIKAKRGEMGEEEKPISKDSVSNIKSQIRGSPSLDTLHKNYEQLFKVGKRAYLDNDWKNCVGYLEAAIDDYHTYTDIVAKCRMKCNIRASKNIPLHETDIADLHYYEKMIKKTLCVLRCKANSISSERLEQVSKEAVEEFETRHIYDFLQLCYHKLGEHKKAAIAAYTNLVANSDNEVMSDNLKFYLNLPGIDKEDLVDREAQKYEILYTRAVEAYNREDYKESTKYMEEALKQYLAAEESCRLSCEKPFDQGWFPDFTTSVANHFTFCLRCKQGCVEKLEVVNGEKVPDLLPTMYHYLQFSYYKLTDMTSAVPAMESFLHMRPSNAEMLKNKGYYLDMDLNENIFKPRREAVLYQSRDQYEKDLMQYIAKMFVFDKDEALGAKDGTMEETDKEEEDAELDEVFDDKPLDKVAGHSVENENTGIEELLSGVLSNTRESAWDSDMEKLDSEEVPLPEPPPIIKIDL